MAIQTYGFIGLGLIGGSIAKAIRATYQNNANIIAYDTDPDTISKALKDQIIDFAYPLESDSFGECDFLFLCAQISVNAVNLKRLKPLLKPNCIITDVGSVKTDIHQIVDALQLNAQFIGGHPMTGSEKSGYLHANARLLENAYYILTPTKETPNELLNQYVQLVDSISAIPLVINETKHDYATAAISHIPHVLAYSLVNLVRQSDDEDGLLKLIAAGGFKDITRIASSSPTMWQHICQTNKMNIISLLEDYIALLRQFEEWLKADKQENIISYFQEAKDYRETFLSTTKGPIRKVFRIYLDIPDETGMIAKIATLLATNNINIQNIGIIHNREYEEGVLQVEFYDEISMTQSIEICGKMGYKIYLDH